MSVMTQHISGSGNIFRDDFNGSGYVDNTKWYYPLWQAENNPSFHGRTQQRQELPTQQDGVLRLRLDTHNASDPNVPKNSLFGSEAITNQKFDLTGGPLAFEARFKMSQAQPGIIGGFFTYNTPNPKHDEIDFEAITNSMNTIQTNIYANEALGDGTWSTHAISDSLQEYHTYRIEWLPNAVRWLVDGQVIRIETSKVPLNPQELHLNIWAPPKEWGNRVYHSSLQSAQTPAENKTFFMDVDYVAVDRLQQLAGTTAGDHLVGTDGNEILAGGHGDDRLSGGRGNDIIDGGEGTDTATYAVASNAFTISASSSHQAIEVHDRTGAEGTDTLLAVETIELADQTLDLRYIQGAAKVESQDFIPLLDLYAAYLDRAADSLGILFWASELAAGRSVASIARALFNSDEAIGARSDHWSAEQVVGEIYRNLLDRDPDAEGLAYWTGEIESGRLSAELFPLVFTLAARAGAGGSDASAVATKAQLAAYFAIENGLNDGENARIVIDAESVDEGRALIDDLAERAFSVEEGQLITRLVGIDVDLHVLTDAYGSLTWG